MRLSLSILLLCLVGCASQTQQTDTSYEVSGKGLPHSNAVIHLSQRIAADIEANHDLLNKSQLIAVTTPVWLEDYQLSGQLPRQLGDGLIAALHQRGFNLTELNSSQQIRISEQGNLILSRDFTQLQSNLPVSEVLIATLSKNSDGVIVNTRLVNISNNRVSASSQAFMPWEQSSGLLKDSETVRMQQGRLYRDQTRGTGPVEEVTP
ncbi:FlgO family outer membrane protein [Ferrimonas aestuarii]|uniref:FlgO domain-containing protein n=1 Tax=Ferrimonas aestuarii TaxID=2569539 RepID=A0A4U1BRC5_9GAMM|nr:FlgO family outer membrane protein [Ferrimonas aestuarii]TKB58207.1 hypothetical protein FCL42_00125 [Ferrimonas aestuarii]